ncbi:MAG: M1 family peptidase [Candidatus Chaera renei]|uniref:Aminopeptidase n=1 Tax=Candidatus Chaera renei TaxID=2506947 RepID=A0A4Q0AJ50_9BACT|nr:MAG: M1 family peptidase [Candidatus Chaera renei]
MPSVARLIGQFIPEHYDLTLLLNKPQARFDGVVQITGTLPRPTDRLRLHAKGLKIESALVNGLPVDFSLDENLDELRLALPEKIDSASTGSLRLEIRFSGEVGDRLHGLYRCRFRQDNKEKLLWVTQLESHHAREVFPCVDEPEAKAVFSLSLSTDPSEVVLANMPLKQQSRRQGWLISQFEPTPRMSPYLLAFVAGDLQYKTKKTVSGCEVRVWATPVQPAESLDFALETAVKAIEFFEDYFGSAYPLPKCDHVALPDFSSGAMENWGLITYREMLLLADPATASQSNREYIATVIAHEVSHQWFGNLVTMAWWNDLWLNESFATLMEYLTTDAIHPSWNIWQQFFQHKASGSLQRDALPGVQPVRAPISHPDQISALFDPAIVYAKGARLLYMLMKHVGKTVFRQGLRQYFLEHAYGNATADDLWRSFGKFAGEDIAKLMRPWTDRPGYPLLVVDEHGDWLHLKQSRFSVVRQKTLAANETWPIPLFSAPKLPELPSVMTQASIKVALPNNRMERLIRFNQGNSGHYLVWYRSAFARKEVIKAIMDGSLPLPERLAVIETADLLATAGYADSGEVIALLQAFKNDGNEAVWNAAAGVIYRIARLVEEDPALEAGFKRLVGELIGKQLSRLGWQTPAGGETINDTKLRATVLGLAVYTELPEAIKEAVKIYQATESLNKLPAELRNVILKAAVKFGPADIFGQLTQHHLVNNDPELKMDIVLALCSTRNPQHIKELIARLKNRRFVRLQDLSLWVISLLRNPRARHEAWSWLISNWQWIERHQKGDTSFEDYPRYSAESFSSDEWLERYQTFFGPMAKQPALRRAIELGNLTIAAAIARRERDLPKLRALSQISPQPEASALP